MIFPLDWLDEDLPEDTISEASPVDLDAEEGVMELDGQGITELAPPTIRAPSPWAECAAG